MKKFYFLVIALLILNLIQVIYGQNLRAQIKEQEIASGVERANHTFIERFFTYNTTKQRYENIKPLMTTKGFNATLPAGIEIPDNTDGTPSVSSRINSLRPFQYLSEKNKVDFMNEFNVVTSFNKVETTQKIIVRTQLIYTANIGWQVDDVEFVSALGYSDRK